MTKIQKEAAKRIVRIIKKGNARWAGDVSLVKLDGKRDKFKDPKFISMSLNSDVSGGFIVRWGAKDIGFGELTFLVKKGRLELYTEAMGKEFSKKILAHLIDMAELKE